jgi:predicted MFS family arabinose efflux permease
VTATDLVTIPIVFALAGLLGLVNAGEIPTRVSFVGEVVPDDEVPNAVALMLVAMNASRVLGPALAGLLAAAFGYAANFTWSLIAALIAVALVGLIDADRPTRVATSSAESITRSVVSAARHVATHRPIRLGLSLLAVFGLFGVSFQTVAPVFAVGTLGLDEVGYGFFVAAMGAGALVAALPMTLVGAGRAQRLMVLAPIAFAVVLAALAITRLPLVAFALVVPLGFFFVLVNSTINVTVQGTIEHEFRGRAMGLYVSIMHGGGAIGAVIMGALAARTGAPVAMLLAAAGLVVTTAVLRATAGPPSPASATVR